MAGYGIYAGVGLPQDQQEMGAQSSSAPVQSYQPAAPVSSGYAGPLEGLSSQSPQSNGGSFGGPTGPVGSTMNSAFAGLGGTSKAQYYLPHGSNSDLYSSQLDPFQMSAQLGGGHYRDEDLKYLRGAQENSQNASYSQFASHGIDPTNYLGTFNGGGYDPGDPTSISRYFQQQSNRYGPQAGVNYSLDPSFGLVGSIGDLNFDALQYNSGWDRGGAFNAFNPYLQRDGVDRNDQYVPAIYNFGNSITSNGGPRAYRSSGGNSSFYTPSVNQGYNGDLQVLDWLR